MQFLAEAAGAAEGLASLEEVAAYLYTACLAVPPTSEWTDIYFWVSDRVMRAHGKLPEGQTIWGIIDPNEELGPNVRQLTPYLQRELDSLRWKIRAAVVKHQKKREREARRVSRRA